MVVIRWRESLWSFHFIFGWLSCLTSATEYGIVNDIQGHHSAPTSIQSWYPRVSSLGHINTIMLYEGVITWPHQYNHDIQRCHNLATINTIMIYEGVITWPHQYNHVNRGCHNLATSTQSCYTRVSSLGHINTIMIYEGVITWPHQYNHDIRGCHHLATSIQSWYTKVS